MESLQSMDITDKTGCGWDTESLSDQLSVASSCISVSSIDHEFELALNELETLCAIQHQAIEGLHRLQHMVLATSDDGVMIHDPETGQQVDLEDIIKRLHVNAMAQIERGEPSAFTDEVLRLIERIPSDE
jgi:hypothetical protein